MAIYALFDKNEAAHKAAADLESAGFAAGEISLMEKTGQSLDEINQALLDEGVAADETAIYAPSIERSGAFLTIRSAAEKAAVIVEILHQNNATSVQSDACDRSADRQELSEAEGWDDFNDRPREHSPDASTESMWTDRSGNTR